MDLFSNNAKGELAEPASGETLTLTGSATALGFANNPGYGDWQRATITDPSMPDVHEIVYIMKTSGAELEVQRGQEGTFAEGWPAGAKVSANVTAGMLESFLQNEGAPGQMRLWTQSLVVSDGDGGTLPADSVGTLQLGGVPKLQVVGLMPGYGGDKFGSGVNLSHEMLGGGPPVNLGAPAAWTTRQYEAWEVVRPSTPNGFQFYFAPDRGIHTSQSGTEPLWNDGGNPEQAMAADGSVAGHWYPVRMPISFELAVPYGTFITEVGFYCHESSGGTPPSVTIGTPDDPSRYMASGPLSQIVGAGSAHRVPVAAGGASTGAVKFAVDAATTGDLIGRFYWRGINFAWR